MNAYRDDHVAVRWLFLRGLAVIYLIAFVSLWTQVDGLMGSAGIAPVERLIRGAREQLGEDGWTRFPTVFWWGASDAALHRACAAGAALALALLLGVAPALALAGLWVLYSSLVSVGIPFLNFQWDILLLETGFLALLYAPLTLLPRPSRERGPFILVTLLLRWLLFRLMFSSGVVKLMSLDPHWADLTAMSFHYETQPLPPWTAWYVHHLPAKFHVAESLATFVLELGLPFLCFADRRGRAVAFLGFAALQAIILVTGNYGYFNLLSLALCLPLLDDGMLPARLVALIRGTSSPQRRTWAWPRVVLVPVVLVAFLATTARLSATVGFPPVPDPIHRLDRWLARFHLFSNYGLFAVMTTSRPEITVEGSLDGEAWRPYEFRWKMADPKRRPPFVTPHMPRLDWQMWFAALGTVEQNRWFQLFCIRLLERSPAVMALMANDPFPDAPPEYLRATIRDYRFSDPATRSATGAWWTQGEPRPYFGPVRVRRGRRP